jgi:asparagine synthase (glutamine-hydrolysing)
MCGLAGLMTRGPAPPDSRILDQFEAALAHRGPDGTGRHIAGTAALTHTRLAIIDLATGDQPLKDRASGRTLVANGEIYNFVELRHDMGERRFITKSDCEPPLLLIGERGTAFADSLRGMYAIAACEADGKRIYLARDPFGIKPLYYHEDAGGIAFASEPRALFAAGRLSPKLATGKVHELFQLQFTTGAQTVYDGVKRVLPGETLVIHDGRVVERRRQQALPDGAPIHTTEGQALEALDAALMDSVAVHQRSDVPYGMFLSGGIDSSAILACMRKLNDRPVEAFTVGFSGTEVADERALAERVAHAAGANFHAVDFTDDDFWSLLPKIADALDDPVADYAVLPTYKLGRFVQQAGLKVVLSGEGGDELFGGYGRYRRALRPWWLGGRAMRTKGAMDGLDILRDAPTGWRGGLEAAERAAATPGRTRLQAAQAADCADWLPNDLLTKLDRCLMAHGVEGRTPMLDNRVAAIAMCLPDDFKIRNGQGKYLLRKWLATRLPECEPFSKKRGFTVPVAEWIGARGRAIGAVVAEQEGIKAICKPDRVQALFASLETKPDGHKGHAAWTLLFYALWHRRHIEGRALDGDAFEALSGR